MQIFTGNSSTGYYTVPPLIIHNQTSVYCMLKSKSHRFSACKASEANRNVEKCFVLPILFFPDSLITVNIFDSKCFRSSSILIYSTCVYTYKMWGRGGFSTTILCKYILPPSTNTQHSSMIFIRAAIYTDLREMHPPPSP